MKRWKLGLDILVHSCNSSYVGGIGRKIQGQPQAKTQDPMQKINKMVEGMDQGVQHLPSK
jgi:hypothetical protein